MAEVYRAAKKPEFIPDKFRLFDVWRLFFLQFALECRHHPV